MTSNYFISIYLDTRRAKASGKYPVKLRAFTSTPRKQKLYPTIFEFSEKEFASVWETTKPREAHKPLRRKLQAILTKAESVAEKLKPFNFEQFERRLYLKAGENENVYYQYDLVIQKLKQSNRLGTADTYKFSLNSIKNFVNHKAGKEISKISFYEITTDWLNEYEQYTIDTLGRSRTTVGIYLRNLRAIYNSAVQDGEVNRENYPFGKGKYQIPSVKSVKKALTKEQINSLYHAEPKNKEQELAKDFWFFSYACNGMNIKDIALMKYENIQEDKIIFYRAKTINTSKADLRPVVVYLTPLTINIIEKYGNKNKKPKQLVFSIIESNLSAVEKQRLIKNFTRALNQNLKKLAKANGLPETISSYWARHSFASNAINNGASMEFVSEALNHNNMKTTQGYFAGFEDETKRQIMQSLMSFE